MKKGLAVVVLAAGKGTRMKSSLPKVLHPLCGRPMLDYVLDTAKALKPQHLIVVLGFGHQQVRPFISAGIDVVVQKKLCGTADAVKEALALLKGFSGSLLVLYADTPLLRVETVKKLIGYHKANNLAATLLSANLDKPQGYGRILRDAYSAVCGIVEERDASEYQKKIKEINSGIICFDVERLREVIFKIRPDNRKGEYYLTDAISLLYKKEYVIDCVKVDDANEVLGINSRLELAKAVRFIQQRINEQHMRKGVTLVDPSSIFIDWGVKIGADTVIYPFTVIESGVKIGKGCSVGPFARLRRGTSLKDNCQVGNFIEIVRSTLFSKSKAKHFGYLGDSLIGRQVNIGAGTVTANYDGQKKHKTRIGDNSFIGSDTVLVAPVVIGRGAKTGAGCVVTKNTKVGDNSVVVGVPARLLRKG